MKRTDIERKDRELRKSLKKTEILSRKLDKNGNNIDVDYAEKLFGLFFFDDDKIYNIQQSEEILDVMQDMHLSIDEKDMDNIIRKAIRKTKIKTKKQAFNDLKALIE